MNFQLNRRKLLKGSAAAAALTFTPFQPGNAGAKKSGASNQIIEENKKPGTKDWILGMNEIEFDDLKDKYLWMGSVRSSAIEGYCDRLYVKQGGKISFHVSSKYESKFSIDIYRIGYYQGHGGRHIQSIGPLQSKHFKTPEADPDTFFAECDWDKAYTLKVGEDWVSGFYVAKMKNEEGWANYLSFTVIDENPHDFVFHITDFTTHAYNRWPEHHSLYNNVESGIDNYTGPINVSSFRRPVGKIPQLVNLQLTLGAGEFFAWQYPFVFWAEKMGYDITYISNMTLHEYGPEILTRGKGFLSVGHDEYWSDKMYDNAMEARSQGINMAFLAGNSVFGRFAITPSLDGTPNQTFSRDGWLADRDLMGSGTAEGIIGGGAWKIISANHWLFEGTGMKDGDAIEGIVGWECHNKLSEKIPNLQVIASGPVREYNGMPRHIMGEIQSEFKSTYYEIEGTKGFVFNAATCWWVYGFEAPPAWRRSTWFGARVIEDHRVIKITQNIMEEIIKRAAK